MAHWRAGQKDTPRRGTVALASWSVDHSPIPADWAPLVAPVRRARTSRSHPDEEQSRAYQVIVIALALISTVGPIIVMIAPLPLEMVMPTSLTEINAFVVVLSRMPP